ncbi:SDR family NAD(P)-dependent oxidoreductase [Williamsia sp. CHRR-6]|uniref:SDR family NAD(P)-dependent oxidoreductase n=1 Tax=Williamsia sp. CHRR-6 TaxID=2835871 RepID=UPI001BDAA245|nr:SDR family NAD(P)-dependent oxidoreductase [Williamsia sp. CHRR-6]MBT0567326.1 SDR family oxidoreductase [Williamsia sp. CHRR-6]
MYSLTGKVVIVTGGASGIGAAIATQATQRGAQVIRMDISPDPTAAAPDADGRPTFLTADVSDRSSIQAAVDTVLEAYGRIDVAIANAGVAGKVSKTVAVTPDEEFARVLGVNLFGVWNTVKAALPAVTEARGHLLLTASTYAYVNGMANAPYAVSKAGVESLARSMRAELAGSGVTVGALLPGWVATPITDIVYGADPLATQLAAAAIPGPLLKPTTPEKLAAAAIRGIEKRSRATVYPPLWKPTSYIRGVMNPIIDRKIERSSKIRALIAQVEDRGNRGS